MMRQNNRPLTHDEKKASEAAFQGLPFDPKWSEAARQVYLGLSMAIAKNAMKSSRKRVLPN